MILRKGMPDSTRIVAFSRQLTNRGGLAPCTAVTVASRGTQHGKLRRMRPIDDQAPLLAIDTASPTTSIAVGRGATVMVERQLPLRRSSERLLLAIEEALEEAHLTLDEVAGLVVLRGPGSFTGLRVGLATAMGLWQARGWPVAVLSSHRALAHAAGPAPGLVVAAVDALRGDWHIRRFEGGTTPVPIDGGALVSLDDLANLPSCRLIGFGVTELEAIESGTTDATTQPDEPSPMRTIEPPPLARHALALADQDEADETHWDATRLTVPIYFRAPAVTVPSPSKKSSSTKSTRA